MRLFLINFFIVYGLFHLYMFLKLRAAIHPGLRWGIFIALFMVVMIAAPAVVRISERAGYEMFASFLSHVGYLWLAFIFLFVSASLVIDCYRLLAYITKAALKTGVLPVVPPKAGFFLPAVLSLAICTYGYFEALNIRTESVEIKTAKLPEHVKKLRAVQISDVHLGLIVREKRLARILEAVKTAEPDLLLSTGDLVDGQIDNLEGLAEQFNKINPRYGKFAIMGNHEFYAGIAQSQNFTKKAGFTMLREEGITVEGIINIAGVDDPAGGRFYNETKTQSEKDILSALPQHLFTILLKHRPIIDTGSLGFFDLQLSGHTHKGQIFPFSIATWIYYPVHAGCLSPVNGCLLYVSRGTGTWGPPIRFLAPPEVTVIDFVPE